ncbi:PREDICTED: retinol dehydrogenase 8 isoform X2 [Calidris pugnax]|uniref:retinol dehydrogenase 8 isoform X2 n=1 Tax=Calidris pugnax TaxID=198806 RepID=UPI00071CB933|nr:PREDICTED: retinol dehydrogenase 8 isoform X2 [Calidris pugnax]
MTKTGGPHSHRHHEGLEEEGEIGTSSGRDVGEDVEHPTPGRLQRQLGGRVHGEHPRGALNNAGVGHVGPVESISVEEMKRIFETNFFGAVRMIKAVLPSMKQRQSGHIVVISSVMGLQGIVFNDVYAASKFAVEGFCESLAVQLLQFNVFVSMVEPGPVNTDFELKLMEEVSRSEFPGADPATVHYFKDVYLPASQEIFTTLGQSPTAVAEAIVNVIGARRPAFRTQTNSLYTPLVALKYADPSGDLSVRTYYRLLFNYGTLFHLSMAALRCLTCGCFRRRVTPV